MNEKALVVQHNKLVEARYRLTVEEQRLIKTLVSKIKPNDEDFKFYEIGVLELARLIGVTDDYYYNKVKILTKKLRDNSLVFINENGDEVQTGWLSSVVYRKGKGTVELRFDPVLKPYLLQLKSFFTSYELGNILRLKGMYSIRIYELMKQYEKLGRREFSLEEFKKILKIDKEYQQYRDFKKFVLTPAQREIAEKTDIEYDTVEKTWGRKVVGLVFEIRHNAKLIDAIPSVPAPQAPALETPTAPPEKRGGDLIFPERLTAAERAAVSKALAGHPDSQAMLDELAGRLAMGDDIKNMAGYIRGIVKQAKQEGGFSPEAGVKIAESRKRKAVAQAPKPPSTEALLREHARLQGVDEEAYVKQMMKGRKAK